jgi:hypothetical protein
MKLLEWKTYEDYFSNHRIIGYIAVAIALVFQVYTMIKFESVLNLTYTLPKYYIGISIIYAILSSYTIKISFGKRTHTSKNCIYNINAVYLVNKHMMKQY